MIEIGTKVIIVECEDLALIGAAATIEGFDEKTKLYTLNVSDIMSIPLKSGMFLVADAPFMAGDTVRIAAHTKHQEYIDLMYDETIRLCLRSYLDLLLALNKSKGFNDENRYIISDVKNNKVSIKNTEGWFDARLFQKISEPVFVPGDKVILNLDCKLKDLYTTSIWEKKILPGTLKYLNNETRLNTFYEYNVLHVSEDNLGIKLLEKENCGYFNSCLFKKIEYKKEEN